MLKSKMAMRLGEPSKDMQPPTKQRALAFVQVSNKVEFDTSKFRW